MDHEQSEMTTILLAGRERDIVKYIHGVLDSGTLEEGPLPEDFRDVPGMQELHDLLWGIRHLAYSLAQGRLDYITREKGAVVGALKGFQANLRHLTWQAQRIADGEYCYRVNFLGDFSKAFNTMTEQLDLRVNELRTLSEQYKELSLRDALTGLYNRSAFMSFARQLLSSRKAAPSTLILVDLDKFKNVNDSYGHLHGDMVLRKSAAQLMAGLRADDICCRYGGEEFLVLMPDTPMAEGLHAAERLRRSLEEMDVECDGQKINISGSFGLSEVNPAEFASENSFAFYFKACLQRADDNLYKAKTQGRNRVVAE